jgi:hypothetical protein
MDQKLQLPKMMCCTGEYDNSVEVQQEDWTSFTCNENTVPDMIHFTRCKKYDHEACADVSKVQEIFLQIGLDSLQIPCIPTFFFNLVTHTRQSWLCLLLTQFKFMRNFNLESLLVPYFSYF